METDMMQSAESLSAEQASALLNRQARLEAEAARIIARFDLLPRLRFVGQAELIGSAVLGLMVWRDIDIMVSAPGLGPAQAFAALDPLLTNPRVTQVRYLNQSGSFNETALLEDDRYYFGVKLRTDDQAEWKFDISFWISERPPRELSFIDTMRRRLTDETRLAILWIKDVWHHLPSYRTSVLSVDIYDAVLEHGVRTPSAFDAYLSARGKPAR
jgi:hypothetical protein